MKFKLLALIFTGISASFMLCNAAGATPESMHTAAKIINSGSPTAKWTGVDPDAYASMDFYIPDGIAHVKGRIIDYTPESELTTFTIKTDNSVILSQKVTAVDIAPDGTFSADIPLAYPQFSTVKFETEIRNLFLVPGDTVNIVTTTNKSQQNTGWYKHDFFGFEGPLNDATMVNVLADSVLTHYNLHALWDEFRVQPDDSMTANTIKANKKLAKRFDDTMRDLPGFIGKMPVSNHIKDYIATWAAAQFIQEMEKLDMDWTFAKGPQLLPDSTHTSYIVVEREQMAPLELQWMKHKELIYNNPLMLCTDWILPNRWAFNNLFAPGRIIVEGETHPLYEITSINSNLPIYERLKAADDLNLNTVGIGNCFASQFIRTSWLISLINEICNNQENMTPEQLQLLNRHVSAVIRLNRFDMLSSELLNAYGNLISHKKRNPAASAITLSQADREVLDNIIAPYRGNVLLLDFWSISCAPCRGGMVDMKPMLEKYAGHPFKALYIGPDDESRQACESWLAKEEIKGEHIFISNSTWSKLSAMFNFAAIPFQVLIDKDGNVLKTKCNVNDAINLIEDGQLP